MTHIKTYDKEGNEYEFEVLREDFIHNEYTPARADL